MKITAVVFKKDGKLKEGRGFSREELTKASLNFRRALQLGIPIDLRRRSLHEQNVEVLKEYLKNLGSAKKSKRKRSSN